MRRTGILPLLVVGLAVTGCAATAQTSSEPSQTSATASSTPSALEPSRSAAPAPTADPLEIARVTFDNTATPSVSSGVTGPSLATGTFRIEGDCEGESFDYRLRDAAIDGSGRDLATGTITCGSADPKAAPVFDASTGGPVQLSLEGVDADSGWVRAVLVE
ncbi:MAG: hypothetical protein J0I43_05175 [Microbacterium sp.]|uniref:hypothetical protein n=1 Tax=Microbacterium sp. TaxID=51671 RepID=UPI001AC24463|nr:hypothetical protein [Microbacterium sp.]MBN9176743.1 hypothetical protein [Microbacterium sp.]